MTLSAIRCPVCLRLSLPFRKKCTFVRTNVPSQTEYMFYNRHMRKPSFSASRPLFLESTRRGHHAMLLTLPRERSIAFPPVLPFNLHPVGKPHSFLPTEGRIISRFNPFLCANLPSDAAPCLCPVFNSVLSPQSSVLEVNRIPVSWRGKKIQIRHVSGREASAPVIRKPSARKCRR